MQGYANAGDFSPVREMVLGCGVASVLGCICNIGVIAWHRRIRRKSRPGFVHPVFQLVNDAQLWTYWVSMLLQLLVYPLAVMSGYLTWRDRQQQSAARGGQVEGGGGSIGSSSQWYVIQSGSLWPVGEGPPAHDDHFYLRVFLYTFFGYLARDTMVRASLLLLPSVRARLPASLPPCLAPPLPSPPAQASCRCGLTGSDRLVTTTTTTTTDDDNDDDVYGRTHGLLVLPPLRCSWVRTNTIF
jgi:hypothetical protein